MKMTKKKTKTTLKYFILFGIVLLCGATFWVLYSVFRNEASSPTVDYNSPSKDQKENGAVIAKSAKRSDEKETKPDIKEGSQAESSGNDVTIEITSVNHTDNTLTVRTLIQTVDKGVCSFQLKNPRGEILNREVKTQSLSNASTCQGFTINTSDLEKGGWMMTITYEGVGHGTVTKDIVI